MFAAIPPRQYHQATTHAYWENFLTQQEIYQLCSLPEWHNLSKATIGKEGMGKTDTNFRNSDVAWFVPTAETKEIWEKIVTAIAEANRQFFNFDLTGCYEPAQLTLYKAEELGKYNWHIDSNYKSQLPPRKLSMSLLLSNPSEFEGGEFQIKPEDDEPVNLEQQQGRAWFFPSHTLHRVAPVTRGIRRSLVLWVGGPAFK